MNAFHTSIVSIYSMTHLNTYIMCVFYIVVFGMTLVWGISTNAPNKGCPRALCNTEIPFPWFTGFLLCCGLTCLLTSYCKRQRPRESGLKVKEGFCQGWKRTRGQISAKRLTEITYDSLYACVRKVGVDPSMYCSTYSMKCNQVCLHSRGCVCVSSALCHGSVLLPIVRLHPRLLLRPLPHLYGAGPWYTPNGNTLTLSGNWTT